MKPVVILGVSGSVAAYRAADLARDMMREGWEVRVCLTRSATQFVTPLLFETLTGQPCLVDAFDEPTRGRMAHLDWARAAAAMVIAPATANVIANLARGNAEDMLTTLVSASSAPLIVAPAMNPQMFSSDANQENIRMLRTRGVEFVEPVEGDVVSGEKGQGKLAATAAILEAVRVSLFHKTLLQGKKVVVTAGPTYEPIDPVRFIGNRSSGKMGFAIAKAAAQMGAKVTLICGPTQLTHPANIDLFGVKTAEEMLAASMNAAEGADLFIGAAAVADFRAAETLHQKIKKSGEMNLELTPNPDILTELHRAKPDLKLVGFAAETQGHEENALDKLRKKGLFAIALNDVSRPDIGFDTEENELVVLFADGGREELAKDSKFNLAVRLLELVAGR